MVPPVTVFSMKPCSEHQNVPTPSQRKARFFIAFKTLHARLCLVYGYFTDLVGEVITVSNMALDGNTTGSKSALAIHNLHSVVHSVQILLA